MWSSIENLHLGCVARRDRRAKERRNNRIALWGTIAALTITLAVVFGVHP